MPRTRALALVLLLTLAGCTGARTPDAPEPGAPTSSESELVSPAWSTRLEVIGQPVVTGRTAVVLARARRDELDIVGVDVRTGRISWRRAYSPGGIPTGYDLEPTVVEAGRAEYVVFQSPSRDRLRAASWVAPVLSVEPASGRVVSRSTPVAVLEPWRSCVGSVGVCSLGVGVVDSRTPMPLRIDPRNGVVHANDADVPRGARSVGAGGLYSTADRPDERIGRSNGHEPMWEAPAFRLFGEGRSSDHGWGFSFHAAQGVFVGTLGEPVDPDALARYQRGRRATLDLSDDQLVAFDASTGRLLWAEAGVSDSCLPAKDVGADPLVRCRISGVAVHHEKWDEPRYRDVSVVVEGYRLRSGETTWSVPLSRRGAVDLVRGDRDVASSDGSTLLVDVEGGPHWVDTRDGSLTPVPPEARLVCEDERLTFRYAVAWHASHLRAGGRLRHLCSPDRRPVRGRSLAREALEQGAIAGPGGIRLLATRGRLTAYRLD